jgi:septal ring factor EnvC (AmiA/AmiB activator)
MAKDDPLAQLDACTTSLQESLARMRENGARMAANTEKLVAANAALREAHAALQRANEHLLRAAEKLRAANVVAFPPPAEPAPTTERSPEPSFLLPTLGPTGRHSEN